MAVGERIDPYLGYNFRVEIEGLTVGGFTEVSGLQAEVETEEYREGGVNGFVHKLPKQFHHPNLILKRGVTDSETLWKWQQSTGKSEKKVDRKTIRVILVDSEGEDKMSWRCLQAYPVKWNGPDLKSDSSAIAIESLELAHCGIERSSS